jgi:hypothetical protein
MGIYDRDWWKRPREEQDEAVRKATYNPKAFRRDKPTTSAPTRLTEAPSGPPDLPGADWHWTLKLMALGFSIAVLYMVYKWAGGRPL